MLCLLTAALALAGSGASGCRAHAAPPATPTPVLVELFTSEGCSDCPPADSLLASLVERQPVPGAQIIGLGLHVDYWDQLGWKDRFSSAALTNRQQVYGVRFNLDSVYTPQMIVDGRAQLVGSDAAAARRAIEQAAAAPHGTVRIEVESGTGGPKTVAVHVIADSLPSLGRGDRADVIVAITEDRLRTEVKRGENHGRTLTHAAVVRSMTTIGRTAAEGPTTASAAIPIGDDWQRDQLKVVAFVQDPRGRAILASASRPLQNASR